MKPLTLILLFIFIVGMSYGQKWETKKCPLDTIHGTIFYKNYDYNNGISYEQGYYIGYCGGIGGNYMLPDNQSIQILWASVRGKEKYIKEKEWHNYEKLVTGKFVTSSFKTIPTSNVLFMLPSKK